jgi:Flp pilus assembly protein TadD
MSRKLVSTVVFVAALAGAAWLGHRMRDAQEARTKLAQAQSLLAAPIEIAPALEDLRVTEARGLLVQAQALAPTHTTAALIELTRAIEHWQHARTIEAAAALGRARELAPQLPLLQLAAATAALRAGDRADAHRELTQLLARADSEARGLLLASDLAREEGLADQALTFVMRALGQHPKASVLHLRLGMVHELLGDQFDARTDYQTAAKLDPHSVAPLLRLGRLLREAGATREAILAFHAAAQRDPSEPDAWLGSGVCREEIGDLQGARADFEQAQLLGLLQAEPLLALGDLDAREHDLKSALRRYQAATKLAPENATAFVKLGNALVRDHAAMQAVSAFRKAIELAPDLAQAHNGLGAALVALGESNAAATELSAAATLDLHDPNPLLNLAMLRRQSGDEAGAQAAFAQAKARAPELELAALTAPAGRRASAARRP